MTKIDLSIVKEFQQVPSVTIKPVRVLSDRVYFVKILKNSKDEPWVDGIYCYYKLVNKVVRIDKGMHSDMPHKFDIYVPFGDDDIQIYEDMNYIFFSIVVENEDQEDMASIIIYALDLQTHEQINLFSIKYSQREFYYMGFRMLSDNYLLIDLVNTMNENIKEFDKIFILNIYTRHIMEIQDVSIKYSLGMFELSKDSKYIFCEEYYMDEEDEIAILTTDMYEIDDEGLEENKLDAFKNSIKFMDFEKFKELAQVEDDIKMEEIDTVSQDGIIRVIGTTQKYIYYKKTKHQKHLQNSKNFTDRMMIGKEEIYAFNKDTLELEKITNLEIGAILSFENDILHKIFEDSQSIKIINICTGNEEYVYKKEEKIEEFVDFLQNKYLLVQVNPYIDSTKYAKLINTQTGKIEIQAKEISSIKDNFFYEPL